MYISLYVWMWLLPQKNNMPKECGTGKNKFAGSFELKTPSTRFSEYKYIFDGKMHK